MKNKFFAITLVLFVSQFAFAQKDSLSLIPTPDFPGEPMLLNETDYSLLPLPTEKAFLRSDKKGNAMMTNAELKGIKSEFRLKNGINRVIVNHEPSNVVSVNPKDYFKVYKLESDESKKLRTTIVAAAYITNKAQEKNPIPEPLTVTFVKVRENTYLIELSKLEPGEYAIITNTLDKYFTFGID